MQKFRRRLYKWRHIIRLGVFVITVICGITILLLIRNNFQQPQILVSQAKENISPSVVLIKPTPTSLPSNTMLESKISDVLVGKMGNYAIVVKHLTVPESYYLNEYKLYPTGSLYKLWVMTVVYDLIASQKLEPSEVLSESIASLNKKFGIMPEYAELTEGEISLTVNQALESMITISHNYAAMLLTQKVTIPAIVTFLEKHNLTKSQVSTQESLPMSTAYDMALFFEDLYKNNYADASKTDAMMSLLKKQEKNNKIPKYLPKSIEIAHKTGEIDYYSHDAGIVFSSKGPYIIVVLSQTDNPPTAEETIAQISRVVYEYFESL